MDVDAHGAVNDQQPAVASSSKPAVQNQTDEAGEESVTEPDDDEPIPAKATRTAEAKPVGDETSGTDSEPPSKKKKVAPKQEESSSTDDSDDEPKRPSNNAASPAKKRPPVRQPVKRGGKKW